MPRKTRSVLSVASRRKTKQTRKFSVKLSLSKYLSPNNIRTALGILFVILGFLFLYKIPVIKDAPQTAEPIAASAEFKKINGQSDVSRIIISKVDVDLPVTPSKIVKGYWETSESTASHGEGTANPGTAGNVVVFAHARPGLFYNLKDVKKDDVIYVLTANKWYRYKVNEITSVYPNEIQTVAPTKNEVLTLFTCSGFFDEKRLIVKAHPIK